MAKREKKYSKEEVTSKEYGSRMAGCFGREASMGIPSYDSEPEKAGLVPLKNRFSAQHDVSQDEAMRVVRGRGTSAMTEKMNDTD
jgi:hypothetical protein